MRGVLFGFLTVFVVLAFCAVFAFSLVIHTNNNVKRYDTEITRLHNEIAELKEYTEQVCRENRAMAYDLEIHLKGEDR